MADDLSTYEAVGVTLYHLPDGVVAPSLDEQLVKAGEMYADLNTREVGAWFFELQQSARLGQAPPPAPQAAKKWLIGEDGKLRNPSLDGTVEVWAGRPARLDGESIILPPAPSGGWPGLHKLSIHFHIRPPREPGGHEMMACMSMGPMVVGADDFEGAVAIHAPDGTTRPLRPGEPIEERTVLTIDAGWRSKRHQPRPVCSLEDARKLFSLMRQ